MVIVAISLIADVDAGTQGDQIVDMAWNSFTVAKSGRRASNGVFSEVSSDGHTTKVMSCDAYGKASARANKSLAASAFSQKNRAKSV